LCAQFKISKKAILHGKVTIGEGATVQENVILGSAEDGKLGIGKGCTVRSGTVIYSGAEIGDNFRSGHNVLIRENTKIGDNVLVGTSSVIDGDCQIGNDVSIQTGVYITRYTTIEGAVFLGPFCVTTNDKYMKYGVTLKGPVIKQGARIGANSTIMPGITIGKGAIVGAGSVVTKDVPPHKMVIGVPARVVKDAPRKGVVH
jgi:acetyltransferase-like isoleucine patch superfamily enzyme